MRQISPLRSMWIAKYTNRCLEKASLKVMITVQYPNHRVTNFYTIGDPHYLDLSQNLPDTG